MGRQGPLVRAPLCRRGRAVLPFVSLPGCPSPYLVWGYVPNLGQVAKEMLKGGARRGVFKHLLRNMGEMWVSGAHRQAQRCESIRGQETSGVYGRVASGGALRFPLSSMRCTFGWKINADAPWSHQGGLGWSLSGSGLALFIQHWLTPSNSLASSSENGNKNLPPSLPGGLGSSQ